MKDYGGQFYLEKKTRKNYGGKKRRLHILLILVIVILIFLKIGNRKDEKIIKAEIESLEENKTEGEKTGVFNFIKNENNREPAGQIQSKGLGDEIVFDIKKITQDKQGDYGFWVKSLYDAEEYGDNYSQAFTAASINKVPIVASYLLGVEKGKYDLKEEYKLSAKHIEEGSGGLQYQRLGSAYSYKELLEFIGKNSDNTATNVLVDKIGKNEVDNFCQERGMVGTSIEQNKTTAKEMGELFGDVYEKKIFSNDLYRQLFLDIFTDTDYEKRIPAGVPSSIRVSHKIGNQIQVWSDCGVVMSTKPYVVCILTEGIAEEEAKEVLPRISEIVWDYESSK